MLLYIRARGKRLALAIDLDLDLLFRRYGDEYWVQVLQSPAGEGQSVTFRQPLISDLELENFALKATGARARIRRVQDPSVAAAKELGGRLYDAVFSGPVGECLRLSVDRAGEDQSVLRVRLRTDECPELASLPWELLYDRADDWFLALSGSTPVIRYVQLPSPKRPVGARLPLRVLVIRSEPVGLPHLDLKREWAQVSAALGDLVGEGLLAVTELSAPTLRELHRALSREEFHVLHYMGHGAFDQSRGGTLLFTDREGQGLPVTAEDLGVQLRDHKSMRLAVLNACEAGRTDPADPFAGVADTLVRRGIPAVVAMQFAVSDAAAIEFAPALYGALAVGQGVDAAVAAARKAIRTVSPVEWATPVLYLRADDTRLFDLSQDMPVLHQAPAAETAAAAGQLPPGEAAAHAAQGDNLIRQGRYADAETAHRAALALAPGLARAHAGLGRALCGLGRYAQALSACQEAIRLDAAHAPAHEGLSKVLRGLNRHEEAEAAAWEAIRLDPAYAPGRLALGGALVARGRYPAAEAALQEAIRLDPAYAQAHCSRGQLLSLQKQYPEAEAFIREAIRLAPALAFAHVALAWCLARKKQYPEAEAEILEAMRLQPGFASAHLGLGTLLTEVDRRAEAEASYREAIRLDPGFAAAHGNLGRLMLIAGRNLEAEAALREAIRLDPSLAVVHSILGFVFKNAKRYAEAEVAYREAIRLDPDSASAHGYLGDVMRQAKRYQEAEAAYREAIRLDPGSAAARNNFGLLMMNLHRHAEAEAAFREAIRLDPSLAVAHDNLKDATKRR
jgi:tetratricopeptide (TPR) repeat protein